jgi:hypothetical protein
MNLKSMKMMELREAAIGNNHKLPGIASIAEGVPKMLSILDHPRLHHGEGSFENPFQSGGHTVMIEWRGPDKDIHPPHFFEYPRHIVLMDTDSGSYIPTGKTAHAILYGKLRGKEGLPRSSFPGGSL